MRDRQLPYKNEKRIEYNRKIERQQVVYCNFEGGTDEIKGEIEERENVYKGLQICPEALEEKDKRESKGGLYYIPISYCVQKVEEDRIAKLQEEIARRLSEEYEKLEKSLIEEEQMEEIKFLSDAYFYKRQRERIENNSYEESLNERWKLKENQNIIFKWRKIKNRWKKNRRRGKNFYYFLGILLFLGIVTVYGFFRDQEKNGYAIPVNALAREMEVLNNEKNIEVDKKTSEVSGNLLEKNGKEQNIKKQQLNQLDQYFANCAFIGNSRTQGLQLLTGLRQPDFFAEKGLTVSTVLSEAFVKEKNEDQLKKVEACLKEKQYDRIFIMFGLNELGWPSVKSFVNKYKLWVDTVKKIQPNTKIYLQSIIYVSKEKAEKSKIYNNEKIRKYNVAIETLAKEMGVNYLDINQAWEGEGGLPEKASVDGVHLNANYCYLWLQYIWEIIQEEE